MVVYHADITLQTLAPNYGNSLTGGETKEGGLREERRERVEEGDKNERKEG